MLLYLYNSFYFYFPVAGDSLVSVVAAQKKELDRLHKLETAIKGIFNDDQIRKLVSGKRVVYDLETIQDAVATYAQVGSTSYEFVRKKMKLPIPEISTIRRHVKDIDSSPGILKDFFTMMEPRIKNMKDPCHKKFGLLVDQVALEPKKELDMSTGKIIGYPTMLPNRKNRYVQHFEN